MDGPALRIRLLGQFQVCADGREIAPGEWRRRKAANLVKLLALSPGQRRHREQVLDALWPEHDLDAGLNNLHRTLHVARRVLTPDLVPGAPSPFLRFRGEVLCLDERGEAWVDVDAFTAALTAAARQPDPALYREAAALYRGDLLPDDPYEDWAMGRRDELRARHVEGLVALAALLEGAGDPAGAAQALERATASEPAGEGAHLALMRLHVRQGRPVEALRQYHVLRGALRDALDIEPGPEARALYEDLLTARSPAASPSPAAVPSALPVPATPFLGRTRELGELAQLLGVTRLLTLTGPGGVGKTRLGLELARGVAGAFAGGAWWVPLAPSTETELVGTVASALGVTLRPGQDPVGAVGAHLDGPPTLLLLDNCEHVVAACADLVATLLARCPALTVLATSREPLHVSGEVAWRLAPLPVPEGKTGSLADLRALDAVALFRDRARRAAPHFEVGEGNAGAVSQIVRQLDGLPLALELAAAHVGLLPLEAIAARLEDSLRLLVRGARDARPEHRTLEAALDWSHDRLSSREQVVFRRLAVFAGGWTLEAAEGVCGDAPGDLLDVLPSLVDKSLVEAQPGAEGGRYRFLEPVRQYAARRLTASGESQAVRERHLRFFLALAEGAGAELYGPRQKRWLDLFGREHDNLRAALRFAATVDQGAEPGLRLAVALWRFWEIRNHFGEGLRWLEEALARATGAPPPLRALALNAAGNLARDSNRPAQARAYHEASLALRRALGDVLGVAKSLNNLAVLAGDEGQYEEMTARAREALALFRVLGEPWQEANTTMQLARALWLSGDSAGAEPLFREAATRFQTLGDTRNLASTYGWLAEVVLDLGDPERAWDLAETALALNRELGDVWGEAICERVRGLAALALGRSAEAGAHFRSALSGYEQAGADKGADLCLEGLAGVAAERGHWAHAARLLAAARTWQGRLGCRRPVPFDRRTEALTRRVCAATSEERWRETLRACEWWPPERLLAAAREPGAGQEVSAG